MLISMVNLPYLCMLETIVWKGWFYSNRINTINRNYE